MANLSAGKRETNAKGGPKRVRRGTSANARGNLSLPKLPSTMSAWFSFAAAEADVAAVAGERRSRQRSPPEDPSAGKSAAGGQGEQNVAPETRPTYATERETRAICFDDEAHGGRAGDEFIALVARHVCGAAAVLEEEWAAQKWRRSALDEARRKARALVAKKRVVAALARAPACAAAGVIFGIACKFACGDVLASRVWATLAPDCGSDAMRSWELLVLMAM